MKTKTEIPVVVEVRKADGELMRRAVVADFLNSNDRRFIAKTAWWAMHNNLTMTTRPLGESEPDPEEVRKTL